MLKRTLIRNYLTCLLKSDQVPQGQEDNGDCIFGNLWDNCDGERLQVYDHDTHQLETDGEGSYSLQPDCVMVVFEFTETGHTLSPSRIESSSYKIIIHIVCTGKTGRTRQDILDVVEKRIYYRLLAEPTFTDGITGQELKSFMRFIDQNTLNVTTTDDSAHEGSYTIREIGLTFSAKDCITKLDCGDQPICFEFKTLTPLDKDT